MMGTVGIAWTYNKALLAVIPYWQAKLSQTLQHSGKSEINYIAFGISAGELNS